MEFLTNIPMQPWQVYVVMTAFALASLGIGLLGMVLGQRMTNPKHVFPTAAGITLACVLLFLSPYGAIAPGLFLVVLFGFEASTWLVNVASGKAKSSSSKSAAPPSAPAK